ncbi:Noc3p [Sporobolomyces koalae]|uniref:Noc3p n=1 Tax=Sporobolomyces koalae TaxID=500713 RepID=UPI00316C2955
MPGKKRPTSAKTSALSKRHKSGGGASGGGPSSSSTNTRGKPSAAPKQTGNGSVFASIDQGTNRGAYKALDGVKKDKKGKGPLFIPVPGVKPERKPDSDQDTSSERDGEEAASNDDSDEESEEGRMDVDEDLLDGEGVEFLTKLDQKGMSASRPTIAQAYKQDKKDQPLQNQRKPSAYSIPAPAPLPTKSELKAAKKRDIEKKKKRKLLGDDYVSSADESGDDDVAKGSGGKVNPEGELVDDLESDDFAFGSGSDDDDLSIMSDWSDKNLDDMSDMSNMSDLEGLSDLDDDDEEGLWSDEDGSEDSEPKFDSEEELGGDDLSQDEEDSGIDDDDDDEPPPLIKKPKKTQIDDDLEAKYEARKPLQKAESKPKPTKLPTIENGKVVKSTETLDIAPDSDDDFTEEEEVKPKKEKEYRSDPLGQRFGRPAVRQLLEIKNKKERVQKAREEIADLGREAAGTGEGEGGLNLLKRLLSLMAPKFNSSSAAKSAGEKPIMIDREIRVMALVSLLAVFIDVVPGYRIRALSEAEKETKVSQIVARQREWEDGLVSTYKKFLEVCEHEVTEDSPLAPAALHSLCTLVKEKPDFNFAVNIMDIIVKRVGRKGWDDGHQMCLDTIIHLFQTDKTTTASNSLHLVRLISRLVRARHFAVRPEVISSLLNLRLKDELGGGRVRASADAVYREKEGRKGMVRWNQEKNHKGRRGGKAKEAMAKKGSKKAREARKEQYAVEKEMREAEGEINSEERERNMTETLKLLFALYFRIVKLDYRSPLLPTALEGLARFAHLVNIDFFRDLLEVLKGIIKRGVEDFAEDDEEEETGTALSSTRNDTRERLLCIVTAFELLQGQGESLNIDLGDFVSALYAIILPLALSPTLEEAPYLARNSMTLSHRQTHKLAQTEADLLFRALSAVFLIPRSLPSLVRTMAFSKRLLTSSLNWPSTSQLRTLGFLRSLLIKEPRLEAMLETSDRRIDGRWKGHVDEPETAQPESTCWFEGVMLYRLHPDPKVREEAKKLMTYSKSD